MFIRKGYSSEKHIPSGCWHVTHCPLVW